MPRRGNIAKRDVLPDPVYNDKVVTKLINQIMLDGKKGTAQEIVYKAFEMAEKYVKATQELYKPGIIGPFCLQTCVDKDLKFFIYDVAPRIGGGTNVHMNVGHPYGNALYGEPMSTGRRLSRMIREGIDQERLEEIVS